MQLGFSIAVAVSRPASVARILLLAWNLHMPQGNPKKKMWDCFERGIASMLSLGFRVDTVWKGKAS